MRLLRPALVADHIGISVGTLYRWAADPDRSFPPSRQVGPNVTGWLEAEVDDWLRSLPASASHMERWAGIGPR